MWSVSHDVLGIAGADCVQQAIRGNRRGREREGGHETPLSQSNDEIHSTRRGAHPKHGGCMARGAWATPCEFLIRTVHRWSEVEI